MIYFIKKDLPVSLLVFLFLFICSFSSYAQCAGEDTIVSVCDKDQDPSTRTYDLYAALNGSGKTTGGVWTVDNPTVEPLLEDGTGIIDLWKVLESGEHVFTYTNCNQTANLTLYLGGYPGEDNINGGGANVCGSEDSVLLHTFIGSSTSGLTQDFNGTWSSSNEAVQEAISGSKLDATLVNPGIYTFVYTVDAIGSCPSKSSTLVLEIHNPYASGIPSDLELCSNVDFSQYTAFNLKQLLFEESPNGKWTETEETNQLSSENDRFVNIEEMYNLHGIGTYKFTYTAPVSHPVCLPFSAEVKIIISPSLKGTLTAAPYCAGEAYDITLDYDEALPAGAYNVTYTLTNGATTTEKQADMTFAGGQVNFTLANEDLAENTKTTLLLTNLTTNDPDNTICSIIEVPAIDLIAVAPTILPVNTCLNSEGEFTVKNFFTNTYEPFEGNHTFDYTIKTPDGVPTTYTATDVLFTAGEATVSLANTLHGTAGAYEISVTSAEVLRADCLLPATYNVLPIPDDISIELVESTTCNTTALEINYTAPVLESGTYTITYEVTPLAETTVVLSDSKTIPAGETKDVFDVTSLTAGSYTLKVTSTQNDANPCRTVFEFVETIDFAVGGISTTPRGEEEQVFCLQNYTTPLTLADLVLTMTGDTYYYETPTSQEKIPVTTPLVDGEDYYVATLDAMYSCVESPRFKVVVTLAFPQAPTATTVTPKFCAITNPTVANIEVIAGANEEVTWYSSASGGTALSATARLEDGVSYFAETSVKNKCSSASRLAVTPTIVTLTEPALQEFSYTACGIDEPTVAKLRELETTTEWAVNWYNQETDGTPLADAELLQNGVTYYAESYHAEAGCALPERIAVSVDLTNCDPVAYDFFIPDGFSPNNDGRNDTFHIPNIEKIYPDFTLEILNRYGNRLFMGDINNPKWDGTQNGSVIVPNGVYYYIINFNKDNTKPKQGRLYLSR